MADWLNTCSVQTVSGMHDCDVAWRDAKPDNLICSSGIAPNPDLTAIDLGFCYKTPAGRPGHAPALPCVLAMSSHSPGVFSGTCKQCARLAHAIYFAGPAMSGEIAAHKPAHLLSSGTVLSKQSHLCASWLRLRPACMMFQLTVGSLQGCGSSDTCLISVFAGLCSAAVQIAGCFGET